MERLFSEHRLLCVNDAVDLPDEPGGAPEGEAGDKDAAAKVKKNVAEVDKKLKELEGKKKQIETKFTAVEFAKRRKALEAQLKSLEQAIAKTQKDIEAEQKTSTGASGKAAKDRAAQLKSWLDFVNALSKEHGEISEDLAKLPAGADAAFKAGPKAALELQHSLMSIEMQTKRLQDNLATIQDQLTKSRSLLDLPEFNEKIEKAMKEYGLVPPGEAAAVKAAGSDKGAKQKAVLGYLKKLTQDTLLQNPAWQPGQKLSKEQIDKAIKTQLEQWDEKMGKNSAEISKFLTSLTPEEAKKKENQKKFQEMVEKYGPDLYQVYDYQVSAAYLDRLEELENMESLDPNQQTEMLLLQQIEMHMAQGAMMQALLTDFLATSRTYTQLAPSFAPTSRNALLEHRTEQMVDFMTLAMPRWRSLHTLRTLGMRTVYAHLNVQDLQDRASVIEKQLKGDLPPETRKKLEAEQKTVQKQLEQRRKELENLVAQFEGYYNVARLPLNLATTFRYPGETEDRSYPGISLAPLPAWSGDDPSAWFKALSERMEPINVQLDAIETDLRTLFTLTHPIPLQTSSGVQIANGHVPHAMLYLALRNESDRLGKMVVDGTLTEQGWQQLCEADAGITSLITHYTGNTLQLQRNLLILYASRGALLPTPDQVQAKSKQAGGKLSEAWSKSYANYNLVAAVSGFDIMYVTQEQVIKDFVNLMQTEVLNIQTGRAWLDEFIQRIETAMTHVVGYLATGSTVLNKLSSAAVGGPLFYKQVEALRKEMGIGTSDEMTEIYWKHFATLKEMHQRADQIRKKHEKPLKDIQESLKKGLADLNAAWVALNAADTPKARKEAVAQMEKAAKALQVTYDGIQKEHAALLKEFTDNMQAFSAGAQFWKKAQEWNFLGELAFGVGGLTGMAILDAWLQRVMGSNTYRLSGPGKLLRPFSPWFRLFHALLTNRPGVLHSGPLPLGGGSGNPSTAPGTANNAPPPDTPENAKGAKAKAAAGLAPEGQAKVKTGNAPAAEPQGKLKVVADAAPEAQPKLKASAAPAPAPGSTTSTRVVGGIVRTGLTALAVYGTVEEAKKVMSATERLKILAEFRKQTEDDIEVVEGRLEDAGFVNVDGAWRLNGSGPGFDFDAIFNGMNSLSDEQIAHMRFVQISSGVMAGLALLSIVSGPAGLISLAAFPGLLLYNNLQEASQWEQRRQIMGALFSVLHGGTPQQNNLIASIFHLIPVESGTGKSLIELYQKADAGHWAAGPSAKVKKANEEFAKANGGSLPLGDGSGAEFNAKVGMTLDIAGGLLVLRAASDLAPVTPDVCTFPPYEILSQGPALLAAEIKGYAGETPENIQEGANRAAMKVMRGIMLRQYVALRLQAAEQLKKGGTVPTLLQARIDAIGAQYAGGGWTIYDLVQRNAGLQGAAVQLDQTLKYVTSEILPPITFPDNVMAIGRAVLLNMGATIMYRGGREIFVRTEGPYTAYFTTMENGEWYWSTPGHPQWIPTYQGGFSVATPLNTLASALAALPGQSAQKKQAQEWKKINDMGNSIQKMKIIAAPTTAGEWGLKKHQFEKEKYLKDLEFQETFKKTEFVSPVPAGAQLGHDAIVAFRKGLQTEGELPFAHGSTWTGKSAQEDLAPLYKLAPTLSPEGASKLLLSNYSPESGVIETVSVDGSSYTFGYCFGLWWERTGSTWRLVESSGSGGSGINQLRQTLAKLNGGFNRKGNAQFEALSGGNMVKQCIDATSAAAGPGVPNEALAKLAFGYVDSYTPSVLVFPGFPMEGGNVAPAYQSILQQMLVPAPPALGGNPVTSIEVRFGQTQYQGVPHEVVRVSFNYAVNGTLQRFERVAMRRSGDPQWFRGETPAEQLKKSAEIPEALSKAVAEAMANPGVPQLLERGPQGASVVLRLQNSVVVLHFQNNGQVQVQTATLSIPELGSALPSGPVPSAASIAEQLNKTKPSPLHHNAAPGAEAEIPLPQFARAMATAIGSENMVEYWEIAGMLQVIGELNGGQTQAGQLQLWSTVSQTIQKVRKENGGDVPHSLLMQQLQKIANEP